MKELELLKEALPTPLFQQCLKEAVQSVEDELAAEDRGWLNLGSSASETVSDTARIEAVKYSRQYYYTDPMAKQAIRLWTDYSFGEGMTWKAKDEQASAVLDEFWNAKANQCILGSRGQRKSSDKLLVEGEIFFAIFLGPKLTTLRAIDPLEISEIITDPEDKETPMFYKRIWATPQGELKTTIYRSTVNIKGKPAPDSTGANVTENDDALVYHLAINTLSQRGVPLTTPAHFWLKYQRKFLAARLSIMLALTRFAWKVKVQGGTAAVSAAKVLYNEQTPAAGSMAIENMAADMQPIRTDTGSANAYEDGRMIKLQICSAVGWPEQYFGDLATGNLATAKTVELPVAKMCGSYQKVWADAYKDICELVLEYNGISKDKWFIDFDFPAIAPSDAVAAAQTLQALTAVFPAFADSEDIMSSALTSLGINNPSEVIDAINELQAKAEREKTKLKAAAPPEAKPGTETGGDPVVPLPPEAAAAGKLINALRGYSEALKGGNGTHGEV